jgi:chromosome segregation ATPase
MRTRILVSAVLASAFLAGVVAAGEAGKLSYVYMRGQHQYARISGSGIERMTTLSKRYGKEFVWIHQSGRQYVIRDAATLAAVRDAFREVDAMHPAVRAAEQRLRPFEKKLEAVEDRVDELSDELDDEDLPASERYALEAKLRVAEREMQAIEREMWPVEREMERLDDESEKREAVAELKFEKIIEAAIARGIAERVH